MRKYFLIMLIIFIVMFTYYNTFNAVPSKEFIKLIDNLYSQNVVVKIKNENGIDVTEEVKSIYKKDYLSKNYTKIYDEFTDKYTISYNPYKFK